jgi:hypothetical protein
VINNVKEADGDKDNGGRIMDIQRGNEIPGPAQSRQGRNIVAIGHGQLKHPGEEKDQAGKGQSPVLYQFHEAVTHHKSSFR